MTAMTAIADLDRQVIACERCPRLRRHCRAVAMARKRAFAGVTYWGKPVPGFGPADARVLVVGLAPAAHGANRTGRMFTGDSSGDFLCRALHRAGFASQATSRDRDDGLVLSGLRITAAVRCAPPENRPSPLEQARCRRYLVAELAALEQLQVIVCLGQIAHTAALRALLCAGVALPVPRPRFAHGRAALLGRGLWLFDSYHPSRQNTNTGRLTQPMLDEVFLAVRRRLPAAAPP